MALSLKTQHSAALVLRQPLDHHFSQSLRPAVAAATARPRSWAAGCETFCTLDVGFHAHLWGKNKTKLQSNTLAAAAKLMCISSALKVLIYTFGTEPLLPCSRVPWQCSEGAVGTVHVGSRLVLDQKRHHQGFDPLPLDLSTP